jgi:hypothetical protein
MPHVLRPRIPASYQSAEIVERIKIILGIGRTVSEIRGCGAMEFIGADARD